MHCTNHLPSFVLLFTFLATYHVDASRTYQPHDHEIKPIYQFPNGTWIENLAVRSNGHLLLNLVAPSASLYSLDPNLPKPEPKLIHNFTESHGLSSLLGITEASHDTFYVVAENYSYLTNTVDQGSINIFRVAFCGSDAAAKISLLANLQEASFLDGLTAHPLNSSLLLAADPALGQTWSINTGSGYYTTGIKDELMAAPAGSPLAFGINGLHVGDGGRTLYFTNSVRPAFAKIGIKADGSAAPGATAQQITDDLPYLYDDFAVVPAVTAPEYLARPKSRYGYAVTSNGNSIQQIDLSSGTSEIIAGSVNSTLMAEPSACQFGRTEADRGWLYVTTAGGIAEPVNGDTIVGGQVVAVYVGQD